ncbi:iron-containing alcohol dehydrogenase, partial [Escherichia coli]|nr:iron-containing alcohol dehydrogenase [Escherichia coli]
MYAAVGNASLRAFGFPREYVQGPGALSELPRLMSRHGYSRALAIADPAVLDPLRKIVGTSNIDVLPFGGECTIEEAERLAARMDGQDLV